MFDEPFAGPLTAIAITPLCLLCAVGLAALVSAGGWFLARVGGFGMPLIAAVVAVGSWLVWRVLQRRSATSEAPKQMLAER
jgi:membrane protein implicated in regulation of membrane protease activity